VRRHRRRGRSRRATRVRGRCLDPVALGRALIETGQGRCHRGSPGRAALPLSPSLPAPCLIRPRALRLLTPGLGRGAPKRAARRQSAPPRGHDGLRQAPTGARNPQHARHCRPRSCLSRRAAASVARGDPAPSPPFVLSAREPGPDPQASAAPVEARRPSRPDHQAFLATLEEAKRPPARVGQGRVGRILATWKPVPKQPEPPKLRRAVARRQGAPPAREVRRRWLRQPA